MHTQVLLPVSAVSARAIQQKNHQHVNFFFCMHTECGSNTRSLDAEGLDKDAGEALHTYIISQLPKHVPVRSTLTIHSKHMYSNTCTAYTGETNDIFELHNLAVAKGSMGQILLWVCFFSPLD